MNEQNKKLESAKNSISTVKKVMNVIKIISRIVFTLCIVGIILVSIYQKPINEGIGKSVKEGTGKFTVEMSNEFVGGLVQGDMDLQKMADAGEYALVIIITLCITAGTFLILYVISRKLVFNLIEIEKSETPFSKNILSSFKQVFILVSIMVGITSEITTLVTIIVVFVCVYKMIEYGITLQEDIDETL